jgi:hypothetical protein
MKSPGSKFPLLVCSVVVISFLMIAATGVWSAKNPVENNSPATNSTAASFANAEFRHATNQSVSTSTNSQLAPAASVTFQKHPFAVALEKDAFQWTAEDGRDTNVIRQLAHNELEAARLTGENSRIFRRQLIYHTDTAAAQIERAKLTGLPVQQITLPGLDGQEIQFEILRSDLNPSGQQGTLSGYVAGRKDSMVTLAFKGGREAFTILSPSDGIYLVGEPREPGEIMVKSINPETYVVGACGNP